MYAVSSLSLNNFSRTNEFAARAVLSTIFSLFLPTLQISVISFLTHCKSLNSPPVSWDGPYRHLKYYALHRPHMAQCLLFDILS
jgi:hypothetical protein